MADGSSLNGILDFLRKNNFIKAEAALRSELGHRPDLNGCLKSLPFEEKFPDNVIHQEKVDNHKVSDHQNSTEAFVELVIREVEESRPEKNGSDKGWRKNVLVGELERPSDTNEESFTFSKGLEDTVPDRVPFKSNCSNGGPSDKASSSINFPEVTIYEHPVYCSTDVPEDRKSNRILGEETTIPGERRSSQVNAAKNFDKIQMGERKDAKDHYLKTMLPFSITEVSTSYGSADNSSERKDERKRVEKIDVRVAIKEQVDEVGRALYLGKLKQGLDFENNRNLAFTPFSETRKEDLPRLPPVKLKSEDKLLTVNWEGKYDRDGIGNDLSSLENNFLIGSYLNVPVGQDVNSAGQFMF